MVKIKGGEEALLFGDLPYVLKFYSHLSYMYIASTNHKPNFVSYG